MQLNLWQWEESLSTLLDTLAGAHPSFPHNLYLFWRKLWRWNMFYFHANHSIKYLKCMWQRELGQPESQRVSLQQEGQWSDLWKSRWTKELQQSISLMWPLLEPEDFDFCTIIKLVALHFEPFQKHISTILFLVDAAALDSIRFWLIQFMPTAQSFMTVTSKCTFPFTDLTPILLNQQQLS